MEATALTVGGETLTVKGTYEEVTTILKPRTLTQDNGLREVTTTAGERVTLNVAAVAMVRAAEAAREKRYVGFV